MLNTLFWDKETDFSLDFSFANMHSRQDDSAMLNKALADMQALEAGGIANPDEGRMVGHYWLRNPKLAPTSALAGEISSTGQKVADFAQRVLAGDVRTADGLPYEQVLVIGIGGSSLGSCFVADALKSDKDLLPMYFIDNTDPDGMDMVFAKILPRLAQTLVIVISKSGGTVETQNALKEVQCLFAAHNLEFFANAVRITQSGSEFDTAPDCEKWLAAFPMWEWVGGRTSVLSAVGLLPLALKGVDIDELLSGAAACDELGRNVFAKNPALQLAYFWYQQTGGKGGSLMAVLPYKDRLQLLAKYLQQLVMESLGKAENLAGETVKQGLAVLGNKGSTDQHSYVQQLVAGPDNAFVVFVEVLQDRQGKSPIVRQSSTSGDYLQAFLLGTAKALAAHGKSSVIITVPQISPFYIGMLIALFERAVGFYASFVGINAYHQPAVEFGKRAADELIVGKNSLVNFLAANANSKFSAAELAKKLQLDEAAVWHILRRLAFMGENGEAKIVMQGEVFWCEK